MRFKLPALSALLLAALACAPLGVPDQPPEPEDTIDASDPACIPGSAGEFTASTSSGRAGSAVAIVKFGAVPSSPSKADAAAGAPDLDVVRMLTASTIDGLMTTSAPRESISAPTALLGGDFGATVHPADIRAHWTSGSLTNAGGQEVIVSAPLECSASAAGAIAWYRSEVGGSSNTLWQYGGTLTLAGLSLSPAPAANDRFGAAIASPRVAPGSHPQWVAVGAPGRADVFLFTVNPGTGSSSTTHVPLVPVTSGGSLVKLHGPTTAAGFGEELTAADFNGDGAVDLAVGAPGNSSTAGLVRIYKGLTTSPWINTSTYVDVTYSSSAAGDEFGAALAAGQLKDAASGTILAVGAPGVNAASLSDVGAVCQFQFVQSATSFAVDSTHSPGCSYHPAAPISATANDRFGASLAVGNFSPTDTLGGFTTPSATVEELAVGAPGAPVYTCVMSPTAVWSGGSTSTGTTTIWRSSLSGGALLGSTSCSNLIAQARLGSGTSVAEYGSALATGEVQATDDLPDLLIGAPAASSGNGAVELTKSLPVNSYDDAFSGLYETLDSGANPATARFMKVGANMRVVMLDDMLIEWRDATDALCTPYDFDGYVDGRNLLPDLPMPTTSIQSEQISYHSDDSSEAVRITVEYRLVGTDVELNFTEFEYYATGAWFTPLDDCTIPGNPFLFEKLEDAVCE